MTRDEVYAPFLDWLKCIGMLLIIYGHFAEYGPAGLVPPIHLKQIGVGCFLFAAGYSLSRETRDRWQVVYNRLFEVFVFGIACAVLLSASYRMTGGLQLSNYLPFLGGANVLLDQFPANPSTWYLGTYIHIVVLWALLLYRRRVPWTWVAVSAAAEIVIRATLMREAGLFIAYMAFTNWMTVFLLGCWYATGTSLPRQTATSRGWAAMGVLLVGVALWLQATRTFGLDRSSFPFMQWPAGSVMDTLVVSAMVSGLYVGMTWLIFVSVRGWPASSPMRFVARNTLIIFLGHMPLMYALRPSVSELTASPAMRSLIYAAASLLGLGLVSEGLRRLVHPRELRNEVYARITSGARTLRSTGTP